MNFIEVVVKRFDGLVQEWLAQIAFIFRSFPGRRPDRWDIGAV